MRRSKFLWAFLLLFSSALTKATAQQTPTEYTPSILISTHPQTFLFGVDLGVEVPLAQNWSVGGDVVGHFWNTQQNVAIAPNLKWYPGCQQVGKGFYLRLKAVAGYFLYETLEEDKPFYAGGGLGLGWQHPFTKGSRWHYIIDAGLKVVPLFGHSSWHKVLNPPEAVRVHNITGAVYLPILSPASTLDFSIGIAYRL